MGFFDKLLKSRTEQKPRENKDIYDRTKQKPQENKDIYDLIQEMGISDPVPPSFKIVKIGSDAIGPLLEAFQGERASFIKKGNINWIKGRIPWILGEIKDKRAVGPLISALNNVRKDKLLEGRDFISALGEIGDPAAIEPIISFAQSAEKDLFRREIKDDSIRALKKIGDKRASGFLIKLIEDFSEEPMTVSFALDAIGKIGDSDAIIPIVNLYNNRIFTDPSHTYLRNSVHSALLQIQNKTGKTPADYGCDFDFT